MFVFVKLKHVLCAVIILIFVFVLIVFSAKSAYSTGVYCVPNSKVTVVIDAGHGGIDGGSVGKNTGVYESKLNLEYANNLATQFNKMGVNCVLTRKNDNGLYEANAKNHKKSDMLKRKEIIQKTKPNIVISLHMDSFSLSSTNGAQAFYKKDNDAGKALASKIQKQLSVCFDNAKKQEKMGDYYIVNCTDIPAVLVECGFLSNPKEEVLLQDKDYQNKMCYAIMCGALDFLNYQF
ncbi:MAG: N-acetylmuramoyl-L-alanine amidase [Clostridia bacterium]|nr:N-acetylmuramoyl-L-alanine amidase [Clostridia bacterium]